LWDWRTGTLWWTDIAGCRLFRYDCSTAHVRAIETPERLASFGLVHSSESLIAAFASGIALFDPASRTLDSRSRPGQVFRR